VDTSAARLQAARVAAATLGYGGLGAEERALLAHLSEGDEEALEALGLRATPLRVSTEHVDMSYENLVNLSPVAVGLTSDAITAIPTIRYDAGLEETSCCVCMCDYEESDMLKKLPCGHYFHSDCIEKWLKGHTACPVCKVDVPGTTRQVPDDRTH